MNDFWYSFKSQPWKDLGLASALTITIVAFAEILLTLCYVNSDVCRDGLSLILTPPLGGVFFIAAAVGVGALGVFLSEKWERVASLSLNVSSLWAFVLCLMVAIGLKSFLLPDLIIVRLNEVSLIGIIVGVFWKGRPYWR